MIVNLDQILKEVDGTDAIEKAKDLETGRLKLTGNPVKLKNLCINALRGEIANENVSREEKFNKYFLVKKIVACDKEIDLSSDEIVLIKKQLEKFYEVWTMGQACEMLEGNDPKLKIVKG